MTDIHDRETRSYNMSQIKCKDTKPEVLVRKYLYAKGLRFRLHNRNLPGKPDLTLPKYRSVIFVNGCFWHGHNGCKFFKLPGTKSEWWKEKIENTIHRDKTTELKLKELGWRVIVIWECELKSTNLDSTMKRIYNNITNTEYY